MELKKVAGFVPIAIGMSACGGWETFPPRLTSEYDKSERPPAGGMMANDKSTNGRTNS